MRSSAERGGRIMKFMDKLVNAFAVTTFVMLGGMVWGSWYAIVWFSSPVFFQWCLGLMPLIALAIILIFFIYRGNKDETK